MLTHKQAPHTGVIKIHACQIFSSRTALLKHPQKTTPEDKGGLSALGTAVFGEVWGYFMAVP